MALLRQPLPLVQYWVEGDGNEYRLSGAGMMEGVGGEGTPLLNEITDIIALDQSQP